MEQIYTIGAYGSASEIFFRQLEEYHVDIFLDIRRRRGIRGRGYSYANAVNLQLALASRNISYRHVLELAPTQESRNLQHQRDAEEGVRKRERASLGQMFTEDYASRTLDVFDWGGFIKDLEPFRRPVLFCVERLPEACHRTLVAARLRTETHISVTHIVP